MCLYAHREITRIESLANSFRIQNILLSYESHLTLLFHGLFQLVDSSVNCSIGPSVVAGRVSNFETRASPSPFAQKKRIARAMNRICA
jgi:hypothetical protein